MPRGRTHGFLVALLLCGAAIAQNGDVRPPVDDNDDPTCEPIEVGLCGSVGYDNASFPNYRGHRGQLEAFAELDDFIGLFQSRCSGAVVHFFCSYYFPLCTFAPQDNNLVVLPPCRGFCQHVREHCESVINSFQGASWPEFLDCSLFPEPAENGPCFTPDDPSDVTLPPIVFSFEVAVPTPTPAASAIATPAASAIATPAASAIATPAASAIATQLPMPTPLPTCQRVDTKYCPAAIGYVNTRFPTARGQQTQLQAETELATYETLIRTQCSGAIVHFLCSYFFPECVNGVALVLEPCRELCVHVTSACQDAVQRLDLTWPACESFPSRMGDSCSGPDNPAAVSVPAIPGVTAPADGSAAALSLTLTTILLAFLVSVL